MTRRRVVGLAGALLIGGGEALLVFLLPTLLALAASLLLMSGTFLISWSDDL